MSMKVDCCAEEWVKIITLTDNEMSVRVRINHFKTDGGDLVFLAEDSQRPVSPFRQHFVSPCNTYSLIRQ